MVLGGELNSQFLSAPSLRCHPTPSTASISGDIPEAAPVGSWVPPWTGAAAAKQPLSVAARETGGHWPMGLTRKESCGKGSRGYDGPHAEYESTLLQKKQTWFWEVLTGVL